MPPQRRNGPPPTPNEILRKRGTHGHGWRVQGGKEAAATLPAGKIPAKPIRTLGKEGHATWNRVREAAAPWLAETDVEGLQAFCETVDIYHQKQTEVRLQKFKALDAVDQKRHYDMLRDLRKQIIDGLGLLGFTPADRARLGAGEVAELDDLEKFQMGIA
jgi:P27 family predicted phage terminase small subunit